MSLPTIAIQTAAITRYRTDTILRGLLGGIAPIWKIYDEDGAPTNTPFPYIMVAINQSVRGTAFSFQIDAVDAILQVSVFTQVGASGGYAAVRALTKRIYDLTQKMPFDLSASGFSNFFLLFESEGLTQPTDGITQEMALRFHLMVQG
jgi:hypothetical protein